MPKVQPYFITQPGQIYQTKCQGKSRTSSLQRHNFLTYNTFVTLSISNIISRTLKVVARKTNPKGIWNIVETMKIFCQFKVFAKLIYFRKPFTFTDQILNNRCINNLFAFGLTLICSQLPTNNFFMFYYF